MLAKSNAHTFCIYYFIVYVVSRYEKISVENKGKTTEYDMHWNETIKDLKQKVSTQENIDLVLGGKKLGNDEKWFQIEICDHKKHKDTTAD